MTELFQSQKNLVRVRSVREAAQWTARALIGSHRESSSSRAEGSDGDRGDPSSVTLSVER